MTLSRSNNLAQSTLNPIPSHRGEGGGKGGGKRRQKLAKFAAKPARVPTKLPYPAKPKPVKLSPTAVRARKQQVRADHAHRQAANAAKKASLVQQAATAPRLSRPASAGRQKPNKPGYRAKRRAEPGAMKKQPKIPKPLTAPGTRRTLKSQSKQDAANQRRREKKAANRAHVQDAVTKYKAVGDLPDRSKVYTAPQGEVARGKDVRTGRLQFPSFLKQWPKPFHTSPKCFTTSLGVQPANRRRCFPEMKGSGEEYPVVGKKGGHQGGSGKGPIRVITQKNPIDGGTKFFGVVAHDSSRKSGEDGYNDHFQVGGENTDTPVDAGDPFLTWLNRILHRTQSVLLTVVDGVRDATYVQISCFFLSSKQVDGRSHEASCLFSFRPPSLRALKLVWEPLPPFQFTLPPHPETPAAYPTMICRNPRALMKAIHIIQDSVINVESSNEQTSVVREVAVLRLRNQSVRLGKASPIRTSNPTQGEASSMSIVAPSGRVLSFNVQWAHQGFALNHRWRWRSILTANGVHFRPFEIK
ncbi:hypothetical protein FA13DRAFT_1832960 [Coprinellus micaceus]|uniref:Uncharacterized protein n=1 Tax=Coprinellus micaceus TaxID=71717 RepID=A0A4Y7SHD8_COPMI|nr:hypothetical protein FA13DRAFT_1832960 [Coprinellus micaceus]